MKKKLIAGIACMILSAATLFCGCAKNNGTLIFTDDNKDLTEIKRLSFYGFKYNEADMVAIENSIHGFMKIHPDINVNYEGINNSDSVSDNFYKIFDLRLNSGHLDDVFMVKQDKRMENMLMNGILHNLKDVIDLSSYSDLVKSQILYPDGSIYFVPMALSSYGMYINYDLLKKDNQPIPADFAEFTAVCDYYVGKYASQNKDLVPIICNNKRSLRTIVQSYGLYDLYQLENSVDIIDGYNYNPLPLAENYLKNGLEFAKNMLDKGWIDAQKTKTTAQANEDSGDMAEFIKGEQPFMITGTWATNRITAKEAGKNMHYGVHPLPFLSKEKGGSVLVFDVDICTAVNAHSKNLKEAETFISYFTNPESVWDYCNINNSFSPIAHETRLPDNKTLEPHLAYYTNGQSVLGTNYRLHGFDLNSAIDKATGMLLNGKDMQSAYGALLEGLGI